MQKYKGEIYGGAALQMSYYKTLYFPITFYRILEV